MNDVFVEEWGKVWKGDQGVIDTITIEVDDTEQYDGCCFGGFDVGQGGVCPGP